MGTRFVVKEGEQEGRKNGSTSLKVRRDRYSPEGKEEGEEEEEGYARICEEERGAGADSNPEEPRRRDRTNRGSPLLSFETH